LLPGPNIIGPLTRATDNTVMVKLPESFDAFQPPHEREWIAQHGEAALAAALAAAAEAERTYAPIIGLFQDIRLTRAGDRHAAECLAERFERGFRLFPSVKLAAQRIADEHNRSGVQPHSVADVKHDALLLAVTVAVQDDAARHLPVAEYLLGWLPKQVYRVAQADLREQAAILAGPEEVPGLDDVESTPMDEDLVEAALAPYTATEQRVIRRLAERLTFQELDEAEHLTAEDRRKHVSNIRKKARRKKGG
jgi:hypothetical protein